MFLEASVYEVKRTPVKERRAKYGLLVLVMRGWPRGIPKTLIDLWIRDAGPAADTLAAFRQGLLSTEEFARIYEAEQQEQQQCTVRVYLQLKRTAECVAELTHDSSSLECLRLLERLYGKVTILCWEAGPPCHRYILLQALQRPAARWSPARQAEKSDPYEAIYFALL